LNFYRDVGSADSREVIGAVCKTVFSSYFGNQKNKETVRHLARTCDMTWRRSARVASKSAGAQLRLQIPALVLP
jgi:hypothetical protein